jgi:hypothetical protein
VAPASAAVAPDPEASACGALSEPAGSVVAIYLLAVSDANDQDDQPPTFDRVNHAIVADPEAIEPVLGVQEHGPGRKGILSQEIDFPRDAALGLLGRAASCRWAEGRNSTA